MATSILAGQASPAPLPPYTHHSKKLHYETGRNDFPAPVKIKGKFLRSYSTWHNMLRRGYSESFQAEYPFYKGCSVCEEWHSFSVFEAWFSENYIEGMSLDKDILVPGNKIYSPETCVFISKALNTLLADGGARRGDLPLGVCRHRQKYKAQVRDQNTSKHLGVFDTPLEAHRAYQLAKAKVIENFPTNDPRIRAALDLRVAQLRDDHANNRITTKL